jgi:sulfite exporter TauE/SafE
LTVLLAATTLVGGYFKIFVISSWHCFSMCGILEASFGFLAATLSDPV